MCVDPVRVAIATAGVFLLAALPLAQAPADSRWWMTEPVRFLQTNISETDSTADPAALVSAVAEFGANTFLLNMGGIVAQYPTNVPFHYPSVFLPPGATCLATSSDLRTRAGFASSGGLT